MKVRDKEVITIMAQLPNFFAAAPLSKIYYIPCI
jgi:hypothetical protein